jgi:hypothetical protein
MCFTETISYFCGHSTIGVLRACPLTTTLPSNPVCTLPVSRATQVSWLCASCARILHARWVDIITYEHKWMHERGTCGCPVQFPPLQHPRLVVASPEQNEGMY